MTEQAAKQAAAAALACWVGTGQAAGRSTHL